MPFRGFITGYISLSDFSTYTKARGMPFRGFITGYISFLRGMECIEIKRYFVSHGRGIIIRPK
jgi:hypothetical protein